MKKAKNIWRELTCEFKYHRGDFETCPHCGQKFEDDEWDKHAVDLIIGIVNCVHGRITVVSECPKCFEKSWVHHNFTTFMFDDEGKWPKGWNKAAIKEQADRQLRALREWGAGICWKCKKLTGGDISTHAWRNCARGSGPTETACDSFAEFQKKKAGAPSGDPA